MKNQSSTLDDAALRELKFSWYVIVNACVILAVGLFAVSFNKTCYSDGCLGVSVIGAFGLVMLIVQLLVLIPVSALQRRKEENFTYLRSFL